MVTTKGIPHDLSNHHMVTQSWIIVAVHIVYILGRSKIFTTAPATA